MRTSLIIIIIIMCMTQNEYLEWLMHEWWYYNTCNYYVGHHIQPGIYSVTSLLYI